MGGRKLAHLVFIDTEVSETSHRILDYGAVTTDGRELRTGSPNLFRDFLEGASFVCGHNLIAHDAVYLAPLLGPLSPETTIDTLYLSALMFPKHPYHALVKDDKLQNDELNNPLSDARKSLTLFYDTVAAFDVLPEPLRVLYESLLGRRPGFAGFFRYLHHQKETAMHPPGPFQADFITNPSAHPTTQYTTSPDANSDVHADFAARDPEAVLRSFFRDRFCTNAPIADFLQQHPVELAYCLALLHAHDERSLTPPWILHAFPEADRMMHALRGKPCLEGCPYCRQNLDARAGLKRFFGYDAYRTFDGVPLQERAVEAALAGRSLLTVFPTGGGKSITFQVPALLAGKAEKGLTVVLSPLQSLMKDQVDNLEKLDITEAIAINGLLDPLERAEAIRRVAAGEASILYLSPESLRSRTIERLLLNRRIVRFVVDEAHCFSAWGQDFRVDYLYIADFIRMLCEKKQLGTVIPVSCFTATAKPNVIDDIRRYFKDRLGLEMELFTAGASRKNLHFHVMERGDSEKLEALRGLLETHRCPTIVYMSRTKAAEDLAARLSKDGFPARPYHGQMERQQKSANQEAFLRGEVGIIVATSAFGMGVDKKDVGLVVHYDISDSLENYVQEAGRAGRDPLLEAECHVLYQEEDLNKHFIQLNRSKLGISEIQQIWKAIKDATRLRPRMSASALELARQAGWDEALQDVETRVKTAVAALESAGYVQRGQNMPRIFADSILAHNVREAGEKIRSSPLFDEKDQETALRIITKLVASRSRQRGASKETPEARVDYIADDLGLYKEEVIRVVTLLREAKVLADAKDLTAYLDETGTANRSLRLLEDMRQMESFLIDTLPDADAVVNRKELNEKAEAIGMKQVPERIRTLLNYWSVKGWIRREVVKSSPNLLHIRFLIDRETLRNLVARRVEIGRFILQHLERNNPDREKTLQFSVLELKEAFNAAPQLGIEPAETEEVEASLFHLGRIGALRLEGGFLVTYSALCLDRTVTDNRARYKQEDYKPLEQHYEQKREMIHYVGEYARRMLDNYASAMRFVEDYFSMEASVFRKKYFPGTKGEEIKRTLSPGMFRRIFGELSLPQLAIIQEQAASNIVVAAGPGSGKTRTLVHKLAALLLMENVRSEQLLMVTFSRAAASEFRSRLVDLIHEPARYVAIQTFHSYCFDLLGRVGSLEKSADIVRSAVEGIRSGEVELARITKTVLVIDEAQDMDEQEAALVAALVEKNEDLRIIAVGDDDQNIYTFRGSDSRHMKALLDRQGAVLQELVDNYRSRRNLVRYTNALAATMRERMKRLPIEPVSKEDGMIRLIRYRNKEMLVAVAAGTLAALAGVSDAEGMRMLQGAGGCEPVGRRSDRREQQTAGTWAVEASEGERASIGARVAEASAVYAVDPEISPPPTAVSRPAMQGTVGVLTARNDEALQLVGIFQRAGIRASLLQSTETYELQNLREIRFFWDALRLPAEYATIPEANWSGALHALEQTFPTSRYLPMVRRLLATFAEQSGKTRFVSDWHTFLRESSEEDFLQVEQTAISVTTMHKAKGREFDHVVLALGNFLLTDETSKRVLYVAATRARQSLTIHACGALGDYLGMAARADQADQAGWSDQAGQAGWAGQIYPKEIPSLPGYIEEPVDEDVPPPDQLLIQMSYKDVHLGYFEYVQKRIARLRSGDALQVDAEGCLDCNGSRVVKFSKKALAELETWRTRGYTPVGATVNHMLYWWKADKEADGVMKDKAVGGAKEDKAGTAEKAEGVAGHEVLVLFPEITLARGGQAQ